MPFASGANSRKSPESTSGPFKPRARLKRESPRLLRLSLREWWRRSELFARLFLGVFGARGRGSHFGAPRSLFPTGRVAFAPLGNRLESCLRRGRLMEPERGRTGALLQKGRKRRRARGKHVGAAEARRARSEPEERRPGAKKARLSTFLLAENYEVTHGQLCELLKYAVLGKSSVPKPRVVHSKQICVGTKSQDPMAICFTNRTKGAPTLAKLQRFE
ncbi:uncharacterized protein [Equus caballus]|uniref:uncharacterized protein n=1 Tax=Equus caballus TaxID=9796 RepID=UPI0038B3DCE1